jgi:hypothetical protein
MSKNKQQKKKERERRVAQKKLADAQKRAQTQAAKKAQAPAPKTNLMIPSAALPKVETFAPNIKTSFARRRSVG